MASIETVMIVAFSASVALAVAASTRSSKVQERLAHPLGLLRLTLQIGMLTFVCAVIAFFIADVWATTAQIWPPENYVRLWVQLMSPQGQEEIADVEFISLWIPAFLVLTCAVFAAWHQSLRRLPTSHHV